MKLNLNKKLFNDLFWNLKEDKNRFIINYGGAGSGKSYTQSQLEIFKCLTEKHKTLVIRKISTTLQDSVCALFLQILSDWKLNNYYTFNKVEKRFTFVNGSQIVCKGLDDPEKIKSIAGITRIWIEEASDLDEPDLQQLNTRLRGKSLKNPQITLTFNPISEEHWIKESFFDNTTSNTTIYKTTYLDNNFIDEEYKKVLNDYKDSDYNYYRIYALGDWGKINKGGEFYKNFDPSKHVNNNEYNENDNLFISFDENVTPYLSLSIAQVKIEREYTKLKIIDEIAISDYNLEDVCREFKNRYNTHKGGLTIMGDATSKKRDTKLEKGQNFYTLILGHLKDFKPVLNVPKANPSVIMRSNFINKLLHDNDKIRIQISDNCKKTINDMESTKIGKDGKKDKKVIRDKVKNISYQQFGHLSDTLDYMICSIFVSEYNLFLNGGKIFKPILKMRNTASY